MPLDKPLSLGLAIRGRNTLNYVSSKHSPDGYFEPDDFTFTRGWTINNLRPFSSTDAYIRRRSRDQIDCMQNVEEEDSTHDDGIHQWRPPHKHDSRSPCPALNTAANHNYIPRNGRNLNIRCVAKGIKECYNISWGLALMLTVGGFVIMRLNGLGRGWLDPVIDLEELGAHNVLEHNASLTRLDVDEFDSTSPIRISHPSRSRSISSSSSTAVASTSPKPFSLFNWLISFLYPSTYITIFMMIISRILSSVYRSTAFSIQETVPLQQSTQTRTSNSFHKFPPSCSKPNRSLIRALLADSASGTHFTLKDVARARLRRMENCPNPKVSPFLNQFADAELCLSLAFLSNGPEIKVELETLREWLEDERLPRNWKPHKRIGIWENHSNTAKMQGLMESLRKYRARGDKLKTIAFE